MTGRDDHSESQRPMPPIPDGGLSQAMPDWLRRPPAWRSEPAASAESPAESPVERPSGNDAIAMACSDLPLVDDSVIDPRELILAADLPAWLRSLGVPQPPTPQAPVGPIRSLPASAQPVGPIRSLPASAQPVGPIVYRPADRRSADSATDLQESAEDRDVLTVGEDAGAHPSRPAFRPRHLGGDPAVPVVVTLPARPALDRDVTPTASRLTLVLAVALFIAILVIVGLLVV